MVLSVERLVAGKSDDCLFTLANTFEGRVVLFAPAGSSRCSDYFLALPAGLGARLFVRF